VIAANPDTKADQNEGWSTYNNFDNGTIYAIESGGSGGGSTSGTELGTSAGSSSFLTPMSLSSFFTGYSSQGGQVEVIKGVAVHSRQGDVDYSVTTSKPTFFLNMSCDIGTTSYVPGGTESIDDAKEKANTPATGAVEVIAFVTGAALVFVLYEATRLYKKKSASKASVK
jgi:hypothetical protein